MKSSPKVSAKNIVMLYLCEERKVFLTVIFLLDTAFLKTGQFLSEDIWDVRSSRVLVEEKATKT